MLLKSPSGGVNFWKRSSSTVFPLTSSDKLGIDGAVTFSSTLGVTGLLTASSGVNANNLSLTSGLTATTGNFSSGINVTAKTVTANLQITSGGGVTSGYYLMANDATGNAVWSTVTGSKWTESSGYIYPTTTSDAPYFSGNETIEKVDPEQRLTDTGNSEYTRVYKADTSNEASRKNRTTQAGSAGSSVVFDAAGDVITVTDNDSYNVGSGDFSFTFWAKFTTLSRTSRIYSDRDTVSPNVGIIVGMTSINLMSLTVDIGATAATYSATTVVPDTNWHFFAIKADRDGNCSHRMDNGGWESVSMSATAGDLTTAANITLGAWSGSASMYGNLDEFCLYSGLISDAEVDRDYGSGSGYYHQGTETGLKALYHFDEGVGGTTEEEIVVQNGTLTNVGWGTGQVPSGGSVVEVNVWESVDGVGVGEASVITFGDSSSRAIIDGKTTRFDITGIEQMYLDDGILRGSADNDIDLGSSSYYFKEIWGVNGQFSSSLNIASTCNISSGLSVTGASTFSSNCTITALAAMSSNATISGYAHITSGITASTGNISSSFNAVAYYVNGSSGASGSFTTVDLKTVTVTNGIITSIV